MTERSIAYDEHMSRNRTVVTHYVHVEFRDAFCSCVVGGPEEFLRIGGGESWSDAERLARLQKK